jgi:NAD(P)-dependent dehydrogenase (short-subunit alcohol dehydrogenase family)
LGSHERLQTVVADLSDPADAAEVARVAAADEAAPVRALLSLVGGFASGGRVHETPIEDFENQLRLNLRPTYLITQAVLPHLLAGGGGSIVCTSSGSALKPFSGAAGYITAKAGVLAFADALNAEYAKDGIRVNVILPSTIDTPANRAARPKADTSKWTPPSRIATVLRFLAETDGVSGARIPV